MNKIKLKFLAKCLVVIVVPFILNFCFVADVNSYTRIMMDELSNDGYIEVLFLGASHTYRSYNVELIEANTGLNVFNGGSSSQQLQGSYYILREANEENGVETVLLDLTYTLQCLTEPGKTQTYIIADYMKNRQSKYEYLYEAFGLDGIMNGLLPFLHGCSVSPSTLKEHLTRDYLNNSYEYVTYDNEAYYGQGFVYSYEVVSDDYVFDIGTHIDPANLFSDFSLKYLNLIVKYCQDNGIELILVNPPMPDGTLLSAGDFQLYVEKVRGIAEENNLQYWDFNLVKNNILTMERTDFKDESHLNGVGANKFSMCISRMLNGEIEDPFYDTYNEKIMFNPDGTIE